MNDIEMTIDTGDTLREKLTRALGFDEKSALDLVDRSKFADEDSYIDAAVRMELERSSPEYRAARNRIKAELRQRTEREELEARRADYSAIRASVELDAFDRNQINKQAAELAARDLNAGRIPAAALNETISKYSEQLEKETLDEKASNQQFNNILRGMWRRGN